MKSKRQELTSSLKATRGYDFGKWVGRKGEEKKHYTMPTSNATDTIMKALSAGADMGKLPERISKSSHQGKLSINVNGSGDKMKAQLVYASGGTETTIEFSDLMRTVGSSKSASNKGVKKIFLFAQIKINEQAFDMKSGSLYRTEVSFPLEELVENGMYSSSRAARRGFEKAMDVLKSISIKIRSKGEDINKEDIGVLNLYDGYAIKDGQCYIFLNGRVNWLPLLQYYSVLPGYSFKLSNKAFDLQSGITYLARQNAKQIRENGYFTIKMRNIQQRLDLPDENSTDKVGRDIIDKIEDAVKEINESAINYATETGADSFRIEIVTDQQKGIKSFLDNGYLKVYVNEDISNKFIEIEQKQKKIIEKKAERKQKIIDDAKTAAMQKKLEEESSLQDAEGL